MVKLFVDDWRVPPEGWELARTITQAIEILTTSDVSHLSLDHDIENDKAILPTFSDEDFSAVARAVALMKEADRPQVVFLHTANHNGAVKMAQILARTKSKIVRVSPNSYMEEIEHFLNKRNSQNRRI